MINTIYKPVLQGLKDETGENICIDGGMTRQMIYHGDNGWTLTSKQL